MAAGLVLSLLLALVPSPATAETFPAGTVVLRLAFKDLTVPMEDWILDATLEAEDAGRDACLAQARAPHSRYYSPVAIDLALHFDGTADCLGTRYALEVFVNAHADDSLADLDGTHPNGLEHLCPARPGPSRDDARWCVGRVAFRLGDLPLLGSFDGRNDRNLLENDAWGAWSLRVVASDVPGFRLRAEPSLLVRVLLDEVELRFDALFEEDDWVADASLRDATGTCEAHSRVPHSRFVAPKAVDLHVRDAAACEGPWWVRLALYAHLSEAPFDLNASAGPAPCLPVTTHGDGVAPCELAFELEPPAAGVVQGPVRVADGADDGNPPGLEHDVRLTYRVEAWRDPPVGIALLRFDLTPADPQLYDWLLDGEARRDDGCLAQARTSHSRFTPQRVLALAFVGDDAARCLQGAPLDVTLVAYKHGLDGLLDLDGVRAEGRCLREDPPPPAHMAGCALRLRWDPARPARGYANGAWDSFPLERDARLLWRLGALPPSSSHAWGP